MSTYYNQVPQPTAFVSPVHSTPLLNYKPSQPPYAAPQPLQSQTVVNSTSVFVQAVPSGFIPSVPELEPIPGVPRGLEALQGMTTITMQPESHEWLHHDPSFMRYNYRYSILNQFGHRIFFAGEERVPCSSPSFRPFKLHIFDPRGNLVLLVERPQSYDLKWWGADIAGNNIDVVLMPHGELLGQVVQDFGSCCCGNGSTFKVLDSRGSVMLNINGRWTATGPCVPFACCTPPMYMDVELSVSTPDSSITINRFLVKDPNNPNANPFGMQVYPQMDCTLKGILLGFMVDVYFTYYDGNTRHTHIDFEHDSNGHGFTRTTYDYSGRSAYTGCECCCLFSFIFSAIAVIVLSFVIVKVVVYPGT